MSQTGGPHAFVSYVREDHELVDELESVLAAAGIPIWRDVRNLFPGDAWKDRIKAAIQGNSLAFIPVFSTTSEARQRSQMREEIRLAIDEYRKMDPSTPWILPVRLDGVAVPKYTISSNLDLTDLNWTDFFGPHKTLATTRLVKRLQELLGEAAQPVADGAAVAQTASDATRGSLLSNAVRDGGADQNRMADAGVLLIDEARRIADALGDQDRFPLARPEGSLSRALLARTDQVWSLSSPLVQASAELGARGGADSGQLVTQIVASLAREGFASRPGMINGSIWSLHKLPAVCVLMAGALGAVSRNNAEMLAAFVAHPQVDVHGYRLPVTTVLGPWEPFDSDWRAAQLIITTLQGGDATAEVLQAYDDGQVRRTRRASAAGVICHLLEATGRKFAVGQPEFEELFGRTEVLIAAITADAEFQRGSRGWGTVENWLGTSAPVGPWDRSPVPERVHAELVEAGSGWWPLRSGLFAGSYDRAHTALTDVVDRAAELRRGRTD